MTASTLCTKWKINPPHHNHSLSPKRTHAHTHTHSVIHSYMNLFTFFNDCHKYPPHDPTYPIICIHLVKTNTPILTHTLAHSAVQNSSYSLLCCLWKIINNPTFASTYQYTNVHTSMYVGMYSHLCLCSRVFCYVDSSSSFVLFYFISLGTTKMFLQWNNNKTWLCTYLHMYCCMYLHTNIETYLLLLGCVNNTWMK